MSGELSATLPAAELLRVIANAGIFTPLRDLKAQVRLVVDYDTIEATGTDTYTIGRDIAEIDADFELREYFSAPADSKDALRPFEAALRGIGKGIATLRFYPGDCMQLCDGDDVLASARVAAPTARLWGSVDTLLERLEAREPFVPPVIAFDLDLLARFAKVKRPKGAAADFLMQAPGEPVLVRVGSTFTGAIMPIDRAVNAEHVGEDSGLWEVVKLRQDELRAYEGGHNGHSHHLPVHLLPLFGVGDRPWTSKHCGNL